MVETTDNLILEHLKALRNELRTAKTDIQARLSQISLFMTIKLLHNQCPKEEISKACGSGRYGAQE
jgi:hypothetical protein